MTCSWCNSEVKDGIVRNGRVFCNNECAENYQHDKTGNPTDAGKVSYEETPQNYGTTVIE